MKDEAWLERNREGLIPGPNETEEEFKTRVEETKRRFEKENLIPRGHLEWVQLHLRELFDFQPSFLPISYSNKGLAPWQGAACWVEGRKVVSIQLREALKKGSYLGIYRREEILAHEAVHAARSAFEERKNEEFFAYMTSEAKWRRVLGPILQRPAECWPFIFLLAGGLVSEWISLYFDLVDWMGGVCFWGALLWVGIGFGRLIRQHWVLRRAGERLLAILKEKKTVRAVLFRLTDEEIDRFARDEKITEYVQNQKCLRWKVLRLAYFKVEGYGEKDCS